MSDLLYERYEDQLEALGQERRQHSLAVGRKTAAVAHLVGPALRDGLVAAATLHDVGYAHVDTGLHPLDGARHLAKVGFSPVVCHLVAHRSASSLEAEERDIDLSTFDEFAVDQDLGPAHSVLWWADLTTGPRGESVTVEERLDEICSRYGPDDLVTRFVNRARDVLLEAGQSPIGSIQVPVLLSAHSSRVR